MKHEAFINQMKQKLEDKVQSFVKKKEEEVELWLETELRTWRAYMEKDEADLIDYMKADLKRISDRTILQSQAYRTRELVMTTQMDDHERDSTRQLLLDFRRVCKAQSPTVTDEGGNAEKAIELKLLQDSIAKAQSIASHKMLASNRTIIRKMEESHDWLCSLADNAVTASESEHLLKKLYDGLDAEKQRGMKSLYSALGTYKEQHSAILDAITVFAGRIHQHASDYLQREQLVSKAFQQYLIGVVSGEIKTHSSDFKKNTYAWEAKSINDRCSRKEKTLLDDFHANIDPLDKLTEVFKDRMRVQLDLITLKLQSVLNGRENDVAARKNRIHKKLAKHVNKACNDRRQRLKDSTAIRRDEFQLEGKCIASVDELTHNLRSAIDQLWVREHLKERRIFEAAMGRMERLEKSALVIWNKHSHLAIEQKEEYEDWLNMQNKDTDLRVSERRQDLFREWKIWRNKFGVDLKIVSGNLREPVRKLLVDSLTYDVTVSVEANLEVVRSYVDSAMLDVSESMSYLRSKLNEYLRRELSLVDTFASERKAALFKDWQDNLYILNSAINRRVGGLKDMEADLEETIRITILQHEAENAVFEQLSCSRMEQFWLEWRSRMFILSKKLREDQEDYQISKTSGGSKARVSRKDKQLDDLMDLAHAVEVGEEEKSRPVVKHAPVKPVSSPYMDMKGVGEAGMDPIESGVDILEKPDYIPTDTERLKLILDNIRPDIFREFTHKITRSLESVRRDLGVGRKRLIPPYTVAKCMVTCCDVFWEHAKLSERCVGRISSRGMVLFADGLPRNARALFGVSCTMYVLSQIQLKEIMMGIDCNDVFEMLGDIKQVFLLGLLTVSMQYGSFGNYFLRSECIWACSCFGIDPPAELIMELDAKGMDKSHVENTQPTGFYSEDPIDLTNCLLSLSTDAEEIQRAKDEFSEKQQRHSQDYHQQTHPPDAQSEALVPLVTRPAASSSSPSSLIDLETHSASIVFSVPDDATNNSHNMESASLTADRSAAAVGYINETDKLNERLQTHVPYLQQIAKLASLIPSSDSVVLAAMLGRPDGSMEMTPHRLCQVYYLWRRTALAVVAAAFDPPSNEYPRAKDLITAHHAAVGGSKRTDHGNISCISPFEAVSFAVDWVTSIKGLPLSLTQGLCILSRGGSCDPWIEDPKQTGRTSRILYEIHEFLDTMGCEIPKSMVHDEFFQASWPATIRKILAKLDLNSCEVMSLEAFRTFLIREDIEITNAQITMIFWSLCRVDEDSEGNAAKATIRQPADDGSSVHDKESYNVSFQTGGVYRPIVETVFTGDPDAYMRDFIADVERYLHSMPSIDTNVILGYLPVALAPSSAHELISDAMKLDISARNPIPSSCCVWLAQRGMTIAEALAGLTINEPRSRNGNYCITVGPRAFNSKYRTGEAARFRANARTYVEIDLLAKYPELCEIQASNRHYGPAGNDPIQSYQGYKQEDHWYELLNRRLLRMDKLTVAWRNTMMNEWSTSIYQSRQERYLRRVETIKQCVGMYHKQYAHLRDTIVSERGGLMARFRSIEAELLALIQQDYNFFSFHSSYLERALRRYEGQLERIIVVMGDIMEEFQRHCGSIKRRGIARIAAAGEALRRDLEISCNGLIMGYTSGFAQGYFDELIFRGEVWRNTLTDVQGRIILEKERYMSAKDEIDRDLTIQVTDRLTIHRNKFKGHLEILAEDTANMLDKVSNTRANYASIQKDSNARLILRIEKAVRESRKLRVAAEQQSELEGPVMRDIRIVLNTARTSCMNIVAQIKEACLKQIHAIEPLRPAHRDKMRNRLIALRTTWAEEEKIFGPLLVDYKKEVFKHLSATKAICMDIIGKYRENELKELKDKYTRERAALIAAFRMHFRDYDLSEASIFERFNREVIDTVNEMNLLWGPSRPQFITVGLQELDNIVIEAINAGTRDVSSTMFSFTNKVNDDDSASRMEVTDILSFNLSKCNDFARHIPLSYVTEKKNQLLFIEEMSMEKNGDMVRPQVKAVMDLLISGIEIDSDFASGYESLSVATVAKTSECTSDLLEFYEKNTSTTSPMSIEASANMTKARIDQRRQEVMAMIEASEAHLLADHSRLDILVNAGINDIDEWASLTLQLIENAFHNAELSYLSNIWPTPPATPRLELVAPEEEDRVGKLKALLKATHEANISRAAIDGIEAAGRGISNNEEMALAILGEELEPDDEVAERVRRNKKEQRKAEKARKQKETEGAMIEAQRRLDAITLPEGVSKGETRELQQGWFECKSPEGFTYYFHPETEESLWQLPKALLKPLFPRYEDNDGSLDIETPRALVMDNERNLAPKESVPIRVVPADFRLDVVLDPAVLMTDVAEESRALSMLAFDTALDITTVIRGKRGKDEKTISRLLGDKFNPNMLRSKSKKEFDVDSDEGEDRSVDDKLMLLSRAGVASDTKSVDSGVEFNIDGHLISVSDKGSKLDAQMMSMLLELGMGSEADANGVALKASPLRDSGMPNFLSLGLDGTIETVDSSSDGEDYTGYKEEENKRRMEQRYLETKELDLMRVEDELSIVYENYFENEHCQVFMTLFQSIVLTRTATAADKEKLLQISKIVKPINVMDILAALHGSWKLLDEIISETIAREAVRKQLEEQLKTEEGLVRQQVILEHFEDIEEMADFLHTAGLSKTTSKRVATDLVLKKISTPKKLAKIWSRDHVSLRDFSIDEDDVEEVEKSLNALLLNASVSTNELFRLNSMVLNQQSSIVEQSIMTAPVATMSSVLEAEVAEERPPSPTPKLLKTASSKSGSNLGSFYDLGVTMVGDVSDIDDDDVTDIGSEGRPQLMRKMSSKRFFVTKTGYKSFVGGWVEGLSDEGQVYYYNTITGESSWHLPGVTEGDDEELIEDLRDTQSNGQDLSYYIPPEGQQLPNYMSDSQHPSNEPGYYNAYHDSYYPLDTTTESGHVEDYHQYYDESQVYQQPYSPDYHGDGTWAIQDAFGDDLSVGSVARRLRRLPIPVKIEVSVYSKEEGVARQLALLSTQDRWQNALVKSQHFITEQKSQYLQMRVEMFEKVSQRVETRLAAFVEDIKFMQKTLKKELGDSVSTERDLRRLFEQTSDPAVRAEKLSFVLESLEKFKLVASERYESAFTQIEKFGSEWELIRAELMQVGDIYDEGVAANLEQCRMACEHNAKVFTYDQLKMSSEVKRVEMRAMRNAIHRKFQSDTIAEQEARSVLCFEHDEYNRQRDIKRAELHRTLAGWDKTIEAELIDAGYPPADPEYEAVPEEEFVMSYLLTQIEMELSLAHDYDSILDATKSMVVELQHGIKSFDEAEKITLQQDGSWYNKHRETIERHEQALHSTLTKVRDRMNEGYQLLQAKLEELDFEVERAAEEELFNGDDD